MKKITVKVLNNGKVVDKFVAELTMAQIRALESDKNYVVA